MDLEYRIIEIETRMVYQDKLVDELNSVVYEQQLKIDGLEKKVLDLRKRIVDDINPAHQAPPHY